MADEHPAGERDEVVLDLNFVPTWARKPATDNPYESWHGGGERYDDRPRDRGRGPREGGFRRDRPPRRPDERGGGRPPRPEGGEGRPPSREGRPFRGPREGGFRRDAEAPPRPRERLPVEVTFLPERQHLGVIVRKIHTTCRSYPLSGMAHLFLNNPDASLVKIESATPGDLPPVVFWQCKECRMALLGEDERVPHAVGKHLENFFTVEDVETEAPSGSFVCIARCRLSGELLGPPNHHSFSERIAELHTERYPNMPFEEYKRNIETIHDPALIEQWKEQSRKRRVYRLKDQPEAEPMKAAQARSHVALKVAPGLFQRSSRVILPASVAKQIEDSRLREAIRDAWTRESRFPMTMMIALRPALRHMGLHLFKAQGNITFVTAVAPSAIEPEYAIAPIRAALEYLRDHPGVTREQMLADLKPGAAPDDPAVKEILGHLRWLVEKGHVIEFFNGTLAVPAQRRGSSKGAGRGREPAAAEPAAADAAPAPAEPASDTPDVSSSTLQVLSDAASGPPET